jgi:hypothetical protein
MSQLQRVKSRGPAGFFEIDERFDVRDGDGRLVERWWVVGRSPHSKTQDNFECRVEGFVPTEAV